MFVLVKDAAEAVAFSCTEAGDLLWIGDRCRQGVKRSGVGNALVGAVGIVELLELTQGVEQVPSFQMSVRSGSSRRQVWTLLSMREFMWGTRMPVSTTSIPASARMASKRAGNFPSRSPTM